MSYGCYETLRKKGVRCEQFAQRATATCWDRPTSTQNLLRKAKYLRSLVCKAATHYIPTEIRTMCNFLYNIYTSFSLYYLAS